VSLTASHAAGVGGSALLPRATAADMLVDLTDSQYQSKLASLQFLLVTLSLMDVFLSVFDVRVDQGAMPLGFSCMYLRTVLEKNSYSAVGILIARNWYRLSTDRALRNIDLQVVETLNGGSKDYA
jgi:hypothetical protein